MRPAFREDGTTAVARRARGLRVALVQGDRRTRRRLLEVLETRGDTVTGYANAADALVGIGGKALPDLVLLGTRLPDLDGFALCRALRVHFGPDELPVVFVDRPVAEDERLRALEAGANHYLALPLSSAALRAKLTRILRSERSPKGPRPEDTALEGIELGGYELQACLGRGSYGSVYRARHLGNGRAVAVKVVHPQVAHDPDMLSRCLREISILASLHLPHIANYLDSGHACGRHYLVMELIEGQTAWEATCQEGGLGWIDILRVAEDTCRALGALHELDLVHRDVKPTNILVDASGRATLIDLGLAKCRRATDLTQSQELVGTANYLAPEVILGERESAASDIYALGVSLFALLTGQLPFDASSAYATMHAIIERPTPCPRDLVPELPWELAHLVKRLMARKPRMRFENAEVVRQRIRALRLRLASSGE